MKKFVIALLAVCSMSVFAETNKSVEDCVALTYQAATLEAVSHVEISDMALLQKLHDSLGNQIIGPIFEYCKAVKGVKDL
jgi:hypothetical protein